MVARLKLKGIDGRTSGVGVLVCATFESAADFCPVMLASGFQLGFFFFS